MAFSDDVARIYDQVMAERRYISYDIETNNNLAWFNKGDWEIIDGIHDSVIMRRKDPALQVDEGL